MYQYKVPISHYTKSYVLSVCIHQLVSDVSEVSDEYRSKLAINILRSTSISIALEWPIDLY